MRALLLGLGCLLAACGLDVVGTESAPPPSEPTTPPRADTEPTGPGTLPASCAETPADTDATLYVGHDPAKAWTAHCGADHETYLRLGNTNSFSSYPAAGCATGTSAVRTTWAFVRIDPETFLVTTNDYSGATSVGRTMEVSNNGQFTATYDQMPFGSGRTCSASARATVARIDLSATKFAVAPEQPFPVEGFLASGEGERSIRGASLVVQGFPGGIHPCASGDYYQDTGGACLQLVYSP